MVDKATQTSNGKNWSLVQTEPGTWISKEVDISKVSNSFDTSSTKDLLSDDNDEYDNCDYDDMGKDMN